MNKKNRFPGFGGSKTTIKPDWNNKYLATNTTKGQQMALHFNADESKPKIKGLGTGSFQAAIYGVWDIGMHEKTFPGTPTKRVREIIVGFETTKRIEDEGEYKGKRKVISKRYTVSSYEKSTLMQHLKMLLGPKAPTEKTFKQFDFESLIGLNCIIGITVNDKGYDNLSTISPLMEGLAELTLETPSAPPKWVAELAEKGGANIMNQKTDDLPF